MLTEMFSRIAGLSRKCPCCTVCLFLTATPADEEWQAQTAPNIQRVARCLLCDEAGCGEPQGTVPQRGVGAVWGRSRANDKDAISASFVQCAFLQSIFLLLWTEQRCLSFCIGITYIFHLDVSYIFYV